MNEDVFLRFMSNYDLVLHVCKETLVDSISYNGVKIFDITWSKEEFNYENRYWLYKIIKLKQ
jgi:hypothetical protein